MRVHEGRAGDLDDLGPGLDEQLDGLGEAGHHARLPALAGQLGDDADPDAGHVAGRALAGGLGERRPLLVDGRGVARVVPADDVVQHRGVEHRAGDRAGLVEAVGQRDEAVAGDPAVRRLDADRAGDGAGLADRAAGVGADGQRGLERRDRGRRAAAGAAGDPVEVPRVARRAVRRVLGGGAHGELVHVGLAEDREAGGLEARDDRGVVRRDPALEDPRAARGRQAGGGQHVLDGDRHAVERAQHLAPGAAGVGLGGLGQRPLGVDVEEGVHVRCRRPRSGRGAAG